MEGATIDQITEPGRTVLYLPSYKLETTPLNNEKKLSILKQMMHLQPKQLKKYVRSCDSDAILVLNESLHNVLLGHFRVKVRDLEKHRHIFESVLKKKSPMDKRRALLLAKNGFELIQLIIKFCLNHLS